MSSKSPEETVVLQVEKRTLNYKVKMQTICSFFRDASAFFCDMDRDALDRFSGNTGSILAQRL